MHVKLNNNDDCCFYVLSDNNNVFIYRGRPILITYLTCSTKLNYGQFVQYIHIQYEKITVIRGRWEGDNEVS